MSELSSEHNRKIYAPNKLRDKRNMHISTKMEHDINQFDILKKGIYISHEHVMG